MNQLSTTVTVVQAIDIACPLAKAFEFMNDAQQWLPWTMPEVESVQPLPFGQWLIKTPAGLAKLRPCYDDARGITGYELVNPTAGSWHVPVRVVSTPTGCHLAITFLKPERLSQFAFEAGMLHTAEGLHTLKMVLEQD